MSVALVTMAALDVGLEMSIPVNPMKAIAMRPVIMKEIPIPCKCLGTLDYASFSRIVAKRTIANHHPHPDPKENTTIGKKG